MYNRYIPQADGTYRRNRMEDSPPSQVSHGNTMPMQREPPPAPVPHQEIRRTRPVSSMRPTPPRPRPETTNVGSFLKQLLPKHFDTEDLLIVLLLLLMSGDCREDQNTALLTLVLYLFM